MIAIVPAPITLESTNVATTQPLWDENASYSADAVVYRAGGAGEADVVYRSLQANNTNQQPETSPDHWTRVDVTEPWKMFDSYGSTRTRNFEAIEFTFSTQRVDHISFFGVVGESIDIRVTSGDVVIFDGQLSLRSDISSINNCYDYFFSDIAYKDNVVQRIGGMYYQVTVEVTINAAPDSYAECANCIVGRSEYIGESKWGIKNGIANYSGPAINQFGEWSVGSVPLNAKRLTTDIWVGTTAGQPEIDRVTRQINRLTGIPIVFDANNDDTNHETYRVFGVCVDFYQVVNYVSETQCNMEIVGLR